MGELDTVTIDLPDDGEIDPAACRRIAGKMLVRALADLNGDTLQLVKIGDPKAIGDAHRLEDLSLDAFQWIMDETPHPVGVKHCCELVGLDYSKVRQLSISMREAFCQANPDWPKRIPVPQKKMKRLRVKPSSSALWQGMLSTLEKSIDET